MSPRSEPTVRPTRRGSSPGGHCSRETEARDEEAAEEALWDYGFRQFRVRYHGEVARIEVPVDDMPRLLELAPHIVERFRHDAGFTYVAMDLAGYRRGSMNETLVAVSDLQIAVV